jgi:hypothetical protein
MPLRPRPLPWVLVLFVIPAFLGAQMRFDAGERAGSPVREAFDRAFHNRGAASLACEVRPQPARLSFDLQIFTGYEFTVPLRQFQAGKRGLLLNVFRVTPRKPEGEPVWFIRRWPVPQLPPTAVATRQNFFQLGGGFIVGPGDYQVDWILIDATDRACRKSWRIRARESRAESLGIQPGSVDDDRRLMQWRGPAGNAADPRRATILLHAAPTFRRRTYTRLSFYDRRLLTASLVNTIDRGGLTAARVVVFDLERRRVVFETPEFNQRELQRLTRLLGEVDLATIDFETLASGPSEWRFLEELLAAERKRETQPDAYIFITPAWRDGERRQRLSESLLEGLPRMFALALAPFGRYTTGTVLDFAKAARARTYNVFQPNDLATATERLRKELESARANSD